MVRLFGASPVLLDHVAVFAKPSAAKHFLAGLDRRAVGLPDRLSLFVQFGDSLLVGLLGDERFGALDEIGFVVGHLLLAEL